MPHLQSSQRAVGQTHTVMATQHKMDAGSRMRGGLLLKAATDS